MLSLIVLYMGTKNKRVYVYHDAWALRTKSETGEEGRAILGKTVLMPLDLGKGSNIEQTRLNKAKGLILLTDRLVSPEKELTLFKKWFKLVAYNWGRNGTLIVKFSYKVRWVA